MKHDFAQDGITGFRLSRPGTPRRSNIILVSLGTYTEQHLFTPCKLLARTTNGARDVCKGEHQLLITHVFCISVVPFTQGFHRADSDGTGSAAPRRGRQSYYPLQREKLYGRIKRMGFVDGSRRLNKGWDLNLIQSDLSRSIWL